MKIIKGIILAGGHGSRLFPLTFGASKQLLPVYDKPMIYYPLSIFMNAGIREILIISTKEDIPKYKNLFGDGSNLGLKISYTFQIKPRGIAESFILAEDFIANDNVSLILGDNIFHGNSLKQKLDLAKKNLKNKCCTIFGKRVENPHEFGVIEYDKNGKILNIKEKPVNPKSKLIVSGLYFYTNDVVEVAKKLTPSSRGELEITDINNYYLKQKKLNLVKLGSKISWIDTGTYDSLLKASRFFQNKEKRTKDKIACIEEVAYKKGFIGKDKLLLAAKSMKNSDYGKYLFKILKREN